MITARELGKGYRNAIGNERVSAQADMPVDKGGAGDGFRPHELLEAALAACMSMTVRIAAEKYGYPLEQVEVSVTLDRSVPEAYAFEYALKLDGPLDEAQRQRLARAAAQCPVSKSIAANPVLRPVTTT